MGILPAGTALEEKVAVGIEDEDVDGAVQEALAMHLVTRKLAGDVIVRIDDVEDLAVHVLGGLESSWYWVGSVLLFFLFRRS